MKLVSLLERLEYTCLQGTTDQEVKNVIYDSRKVEEGSLFICIRGAVVDGHKFVPDVVAKGAKVLLCYGLYFSSIFRLSGRKAENNRNYRNQGKNHHHLYGQIHSGKCWL